MAERLAKKSEGLHMNPWISAGLGAGAGALLGHLLTQGKGVAYSVVFITDNEGDAIEIESFLYGMRLDPVRDYAPNAIRGKGIPRLWLVAVPDANASQAQETIMRVRGLFTNPPQKLPEPLPQQEPAPSLPNPREV